VVPMMPLPNGSNIIMRSRPRHHDASNTNHLLFLHRVPDHRERLLADVVLRCEIVGCVPISDRRSRPLAQTSARQELDLSKGQCAMEESVHDRQAPTNS